MIVYKEYIERIYTDKIIYKYEDWHIKKWFLLGFIPLLIKKIRIKQYP